MSAWGWRRATGLTICGLMELTCLIAGCQSVASPERVVPVASASAHFALRFALGSERRDDVTPLDDTEQEPSVASPDDLIIADKYLYDARIYAGKLRGDYGGLRISETPEPTSTSAGILPAADSPGPYYTEMDTVSTSGAIIIEVTDLQMYHPVNTSWGINRWDPKIHNIPWPNPPAQPPLPPMLGPPWP